MIYFKLFWHTSHYLLVLRNIGKSWVCMAVPFSTVYAVRSLHQTQAHVVRISMDGKRRWMDNVFSERAWRSLEI